MIKHKSYLDVNPETRKKAGARRLMQLRQTLSDRSLAPEQRLRVEDEVALVNAWMAGLIEPVPIPKEGAPVGKNHVVEVSERLSVEEN